MKKCGKLANERLQDLNKTIRKALLKGEIISGIVRTKSGDLIAKCTGIIVDNTNYYGIWEKDMLEGKWHLLHFGVKEDIESEWKDFTDFWIRHGESIIPMAA